MDRRTFFRRLLVGLGVTVTGTATTGRSVLIQDSPVAGFEFHRGAEVWSSLSVGAHLKLVREPKNSHDGKAVAVYFQKDKLGYVPRAENSAIAQMLDRGERLAATISQLTIDDDPWQRVRFSVFLV